MATEYTITYTYKGQGNTSSKRSVDFNKFTASGDTDRTIGQITSITYVHYHTSTNAMTWELKGQLVFSDGTTIISPTVENRISGNIVKFTHTFDTLPTAEQFAKLTSVQTLDSQDKITIGGYAATLYWRADKSNPMELIVTFVEEPPVVYAPKIDEFAIVRCNSNGFSDNEGQYIATTLKLSIGNEAGLQGAQCRIYYSANTYPEIGVSQYVDLTSRMSTLISGVALNTTILTGVWGLGNVWHFVVVFIAGEENDVATESIARGTTSLHVSGYPGGGVAIGGFSTGTTTEPKFEAYPIAYFYGGIDGVTNYSANEVKTGGTWIDGKPIYKQTWYANITSTNGDVTVGTIVDLETIIDIRGSLQRDTSGSWFSPSYFVSTSNYAYTKIGSTGTVTVYTTSAVKGFITVEYTKSTD